MIVLNKEEYKWFLDTLDEFWWRWKPGTWAKHLVQRSYELWLSYGWNGRGEYLVLTLQGDKQAKKIFFPGGMEGRGWWRLLVAIFELSDRPINVSKSMAGNVTAKPMKPQIVVSQHKQPWCVSFNHPHCSVPIEVVMEVRGAKSYWAALRDSDGISHRVGQRKPASVSNRVDPRRKFRASNRAANGFSRFGPKEGGASKKVGRTDLLGH